MKNSPALQRKSGSALPPLNGCCKMLLLAARASVAMNS